MRQALYLSAFLIVGCADDAEEVSEVTLPSDAEVQSIADEADAAAEAITEENADDALDALEAAVGGGE